MLSVVQAWSVRAPFGVSPGLVAQAGPPRSRDLYTRVGIAGRIWGMVWAKHPAQNVENFIASRRIK